MMEKTSFEDIETSSQIESKKETESIAEINSVFYEKDGNPVDTGSEINEDFCAVKERIKYEKTERAENIETVHTESTTLSENCEIPKSEQSLEFSRKISEFTDYTPLMSLCRLCATRSNSIVYMFSQNDLQNDIIVKIEFCLPIEKLELCYEFHKTVKAAKKQFLTFNDGQCNEEKYKSFSYQDAHNNIVKPQTILQELSETDAETLENSTRLSNSMLWKETYYTNKPNEESKTESSSDEDQSTFNSLQTDPLEILNDIEETLGFELNPSTPKSYFSLIDYRYQDSNNPNEESRNDESDDDIVIREEVFDKRTSTEQRIIGHELIKCQDCTETFETLNQWLAHSSIHASKGYFLRTRKNCNKHRLEHEEDEDLRRGVQTNSGNKSVNKTLKKAKFKAKIKFNSKISSKNKLHCKKFNRDIDSETSPCQHMLTVHKQQKKSSPNICERKSSASGQPITLQCKLDRSFECKLCNKRYWSNHILEMHMKTDCSGPLVSTKKRFLCTYCKRRFRQKVHLTKHLRIHTGERPYDCDLCGKIFVAKDKRDSHRRIHMGERPYKCSKCEKKFTTYSGLVAHSVVHSDAKPYGCYLCHLSFKRSYARNLHMRKHTGDHPYDCDLCSKMFTRKDLRDNHRRSHTGEKPFKCLKCEKRFASSSGLRHHVNIVTTCITNRSKD